MAHFIFISIIAIIVTLFFLANAGILLWLKKKCKIENPNYKNSVKILLLLTLLSPIVSIPFIFIEHDLIQKIIGVSIGFVLLRYLLKRYYSQASWKQSSSIYIGFVLANSVLTLLIVPTTRSYVVEPFLVSGQSMNPTLSAGDYLLIERLGSKFKRGDVIVHEYTAETGVTFFIHRIVGLPSEKVDIKDGVILINGEAGKEHYYTETTPGVISVILNQDEYFVLGDNRSKSFDSRSFGPVKVEDIRGRYFYKLFLSFKGLFQKTPEP